MAIVAKDIIKLELMDEHRIGVNEDEQSRYVLNLCQELGLIRKDNDGPNCNTCGETMKLCVLLSNSDKYLWRCRKTYTNSSKKRVKCSSWRSIRANTIFENSNLSLSTILLIINFWCGGSSNKFIAEQCKVSERTVVFWAKKFQEVALDCCVYNAPKIGGPGKTVEIDESKFGKRKYHRGRRVDGTWVFGGVERDTGRIFMVPVKKRSANYLVPIIQHFILPGTTIVSDCWKAYGGLSSMGFDHLTVNHSISFKDPVTGEHTNTIEGSWRHAKESVGNKSRRSYLLNGKLAVYMFFSWCRRSKLDKFKRFCQAAADFCAQDGDEVSDRAAEWFALKERLDAMEVTEEEVVQLPEESDEESSENEPDAAELDNENDPDYV